MSASAPRTKDSALTRRRILDAAIDEFAAYGLAGGRVDRIAAEAGCNKAMIYRYFGSKDQLFDAVFETMVVATVDAVAFDASDLPGYTGSLLEQHLKQPAILRIATWDRLERDGAGVRLAVVVNATESKIAAIRAAQDAGELTTSFAPEAILRFVTALSQPPHGALGDALDASEASAAVAAILGARDGC